MRLGRAQQYIKHEFKHGGWAFMDIRVWTRSERFHRGRFIISLSHKPNSSSVRLYSTSNRITLTFIIRQCKPHGNAVSLVEMPSLELRASGSVLRWLLWRGPICRPTVGIRKHNIGKILRPYSTQSTYLRPTCQGPCCLRLLRVARDLGKPHTAAVSPPRSPGTLAVPEKSPNRSRGSFLGGPMKHHSQSVGFMA